MRVKAVHLALQRHLPPGVLREEAPVIDAKYLGTLLQRVALDHPDDYNRVVKKLGDIGRMAAYTQGESMGVEDLRDPIDTKGILSVMDKEIAAIKADDPAERRQKTEDIWLRYASRLEREAMQAAKLKGNAVADSVVSGARGKPLQLRAMLSTPALFEDSAGRIIPIFARSSYSAGVSPAEMLAGTYGARTSVTATKTSTAKGGFWSKMLAQAAADVVVTEDDCGTTNGIDLTPDDPSLRHRVLARDGAGGALKGGELITRKTLATIQNKHKGPVLVRSAITCESKRGVCAKCAGAGPDGRLPHIGDNVGVTAAQSLGEPVCLHGSTLVRMADGSVRPITEIKVGDMVMGSDLQGRLTPTRVVNTFINGLRHCYKTTVRKGFGKRSEQIELVSTLEHKVLSFHGPRRKTPFPSILPIEAPSNRAHRHVVFMSQGCKKFKGRKEPLALMLGLMTGDGSYTGNLTSKGVAFSCYDPELVEYVKAYLAPHRLRLAAQGAGEFRVSAFDQRREFEMIDGVQVRNKLKHLLTIEKMWRQSSGNKTAPANIWKWDNASVAAYVGGLIATDGWVTRGKKGGVVGIASNSLALLTTVKELLEVRFGLFSCRISPKRKKRADGTHYAPTYELVYCGKDNLSVIQREIKVPGCKQARLDKLASSLPVSAKKNGRFAVLSQTYVGYEMTYDIEVDNATHLFALANGLIVSNTQSALNTKHCLLKGTLVRMADYSVRPIELISVGEQVLGSDRHGNTFPVTVTNVWDQGLQEVQQYNFRRGQTAAYSSVVCTAEHAILSHVRGTENPAKLPAGYASAKLAAVLPKDASSTGTSSDLALLCGLLLGDGIRWNPDAPGAPRMSCADPKLVMDLNKLISSYQLKAVKAARSHDYRIVFTAYSKQGQKRNKGTGRLIEDPAKQHPLKKAMRTWGMDGKYAHEKTLPPDVLSWDAASAAALIAGYLATDGSLGINGQGSAFISFGSTSLTLLQQLKQLLELRLCVYAGSITKTRQAGQGNSKHDLFALCITRQDQISRLLRKLPHVPGVKGTKVLEVLRLCDSRKARNSETFFRANRKSIEDKGIGHCFDISVAHEDELFVLANGLIVSNTSGAAQGRRTYAGLDWLARFVQVPDNFPDRAPLSEAEGVARLEKAPQGGTYVKIGEHTHYVPQHLAVLVKDGEQVEAGTQLSDGIVRPDDVVRIKGLGEGRLYYARRLKQMLDDGGTPANPRQAEIVARGAVNHVRLNQADNFTGYLPDDPVRYNDLLDQWEEDKEAVDSRPEAASGMYLQRPALHFTVGTRLTPSMTKKLKSVGVESIRVSSNPPPFSSEMMRLQTQAYANPDWLASQQTSYLGRQLSDAARRGQDTNVKHNVHFAPALAYGVEFGKRLEETGRY